MIHLETSLQYCTDLACEVLDLGACLGLRDVEYRPARLLYDSGYGKFTRNLLSYPIVVVNCIRTG